MRILTPVGHLLAAVEDANVVEAEKAAGEKRLSAGVLAVDPPEEAGEGARCTGREPANGGRSSAQLDAARRSSTQLNAARRSSTQLDAARRSADDMAATR